MKIEYQRELRALHERFKNFECTELLSDTIDQVTGKEFILKYAIANLQNRENQLRGADVSEATFINDKVRSMHIDQVNHIKEELTIFRDRKRSLVRYFKLMEIAKLSESDNPNFVLQL